MRRDARSGTCAGVVGAVALAVGIVGCRPPSGSVGGRVAAGDVARPTLACVGATVIAAPDATPITDAVVLIAGAHITSVGPRSQAPAVPPDVPRLRCEGALVLAGFWNAHVHLADPSWEGAVRAPAAEAEAALTKLLLRWGFVHAVDAGSFPATTFALRRRIQAGEVRGPSIVSAAGASFIAEGGQPVYVPVPLPALATAAEATRQVGAAIDRGADAVKLFTASVVARPPAPVMPLAVVRAATTEAHRRGVRVLAHPTNLAGVRVAAAGGVDVLAHTAPEDGPWSPGDVASLRAANIALIPTLRLWRVELHDRPQLLAAFESAALAQVKAFSAAGGRLLFGTDTGYLSDSDPTEEYELLSKAGLSFALILAMLTTAPAELFGHGTGRLAPGADADLVVLDRDPRLDPTAFTSVRQAVRAGVVLYGR